MTKSIYVIYPQTEKAKDWIEENVEYKGHNVICEGVAVEWLYITSILAGMKQDGLRIDEDYTVT